MRHFIRDVAVAAVTFTALTNATTSYEHLTAPIANGCNNYTWPTYDYYTVQTKVAEYEAIMADARVEIQKRVDCETSALARLQQLTNVQNADPRDYLLNQAQKDVMKEAHEKQERMQDLLLYEIGNAADEYERFRLTIPDYQVRIDEART